MEICSLYMRLWPQDYPGTPGTLELLSIETSTQVRTKVVGMRCFPSENIEIRSGTLV